MLQNKTAVKFAVRLSFIIKLVLLTIFMMDDFVEGRGRSSGSRSRSGSRRRSGGRSSRSRSTSYNYNMATYGYAYTYGSAGPTVVIFGGSYYTYENNIRVHHTANANPSPLIGCLVCCIFVCCCCCISKGSCKS